MPGEHRGRVLVVDDDETIRMLERDVLRSSGYDVIESGSAEHALGVIFHASPPPDVVLLDNRLPGMTGVEALARLRATAATRTLPVILVTADDEVRARVAGLESGADDYVIKPFSPEELLARVGARIRQRSAWDELVAVHIEERAAVARVLRAAATDGSLDTRVAALCDAFCEMNDVAASAVVLFDDEAVAMVMATSGQADWPLEAGTMVPTSTARYFSMRAAVGPWVDARDGAVYAPIGRRDRLQGLLALAPAATRDPHAMNHALATVIDFATMTEGLLRADLDVRGRQRRRRLQIENVVREGSFAAHFQPIVDLRHDGFPVVGLEALTRFDDGMSPEARFRFAAACGLGMELERVTLERALHDMARLDSDGWVSVNVSPTYLMHDGDLGELIAGCGREIVLELSEQEPVDDYVELERRVRRLGPSVRLSVDDAGSGFASLRHILLLEPDYVKLDRTWVHDVDADPARQALIAGLVHFATQTGSKLIAEGIETDAERQALEALGVDYGQGYLLGFPQAVAAV